MARVKINQMDALKDFVNTLKTKYPNAKTYDRATVEEVAKTNPAGFTQFASNANGYGKITRLSRGMYVIPSNWETTPPWVKASSATN